MAIRRQPSVVFIKLPPGSTFHIDFQVGTHAGPVQAELYEIDLATPGVVSQHSQSIQIAVGIGCSGLVRIPITGTAPTGTVVYRVTDASGNVIRSRKHDLAQLGLTTGDIYICRCDGEPA